MATSSGRRVTRALLGGTRPLESIREDRAECFGRCVASGAGLALPGLLGGALRRRSSSQAERWRRRMRSGIDEPLFGVLFVWRPGSQMRRRQGWVML